MKVRESIAAFLNGLKATHNGPELIERWTPNLETQVNVSAAGGKPVDGRRGTYADDKGATWWNIRIPKGANSEPEWKDYELRWSLADRVEAIGSTGWDYVARESRWVGFDFDSISGHAAGVGITDEKLDAVKCAACAVPWVEVRKSTGGKGLHLYVYFEAGIATATHTEHAALARAVLALLSAEAGFDFASQIDACGAVLWFWHRKMTAENQGLALIKAAEREFQAKELPSNWRDHADVVTRKRKKVCVAGIDNEADFEKLATARKFLPLDAEHKKIIAKLTAAGHPAIWVPDFHLLQTHTLGLAAIAPEYKGFFQTLSAGSTPINCFCFPLPDGAFAVYRFSPGVREAETWNQGSGWTWCHFNRVPTLAEACRALGAGELENNKGFQFGRADDAVKAAVALGETITLPEGWGSRSAVLRAARDHRLIVDIARVNGDARPSNAWADTPKAWTMVCRAKTDGPARSADDDAESFDHLVRVTVTPGGESAGVYCCSAGGSWDLHNAGMVEKYLLGAGFKGSTAAEILGAAVRCRWEKVCLPFQPEYPGGRRWNMGAPQLRVRPADERDLPHPHWDRLYDHAGQGLNEAIKGLQWAQDANILTGADYLRCWFASILRAPFEPLPYLFLYGPENSGKSILWESFELLVTRGVVKADRTLSANNEFCGELAGAILCVVEEKNIAESKGAANRIKDFVTSRTLSIRQMRRDAYQIPNTSHWVQLSNDPTACPVWAGDTRITVLNVPTLAAGSEIPKAELLDRLQSEAPAFLRTLLDLQLPTPTGRLRIPVVETESKVELVAENSAVAEFVKDCVQYKPGKKVAKGLLYRCFEQWAQANERATLDRYAFGRQVKPLLDVRIKAGKVPGPDGKRVDGYSDLLIVSA